MNDMEPSPGSNGVASSGLRFTIRKLLRASARAALGTTLAGEQRPYVSLVTTACDVDGSPLLLLSRLADHTRNLDDDAHVSLLFDATEGYANPQQGPRVTIMGRAEYCSDERVRRRFLARHPKASLYAGFADFAFYRVPLERAHWVGGFGRAVWVDQQLACDWTLSNDFAQAETDILARLNQDHAEVLTTLASRLLKRRGKGWKVVAIDPDGIDLERTQTVARLPFEQPLTAADEAQPTLIALAHRAKVG